MRIQSFLSTIQMYVLYIIFPFGLLSYTCGYRIIYVCDYTIRKVYILHLHVSCLYSIKYPPIMYVYDISNGYILVHMIKHITNTYMRLISYFVVIYVIKWHV